MKFVLFASSILFMSLTLMAQLPPRATINDIQIAGSGCEAGSANAIITPDLNYLSVLYDKFSVEIGKGTQNPGARALEKKCTIQVKMFVPAGWNFKFGSVEYRGFVAVPTKATVAYQLITVEAEGGRGLAFDQNVINGPKMQNYSTLVTNAGGKQNINTGSNNPLDKLGGLINIIGGLKNSVDTLKAGDLLGCSNQDQVIAIKIKSTIGVRNLLADLIKPAVKIVVDSTDASFRQNLKINWKRCF
ncbi:MAG: DUF4360 domain-containing protein [Pseudobdellovibrio sp.]